MAGDVNCIFLVGIIYLEYCTSIWLALFSTFVFMKINKISDYYLLN